MDKFIVSVTSNEITIDTIRAMVDVINSLTDKEVNLWRNKPGRYTLSDRKSCPVFYNLSKLEMFYSVRGALYSLLANREGE